MRPFVSLSSAVAPAAALSLAIVLAGVSASPILAQSNSDVTLTAETGTESEAPLLVADRIFVDDQDRLVAEGNVEVLFQGNTLRAGRIVFDETTDRLTIEGPVRLIAPDGRVLIAETAKLDRDLQNGLLEGARLILDRQLQIAATEALRVNGELTQLSRVALSSCQVCGDKRPPLWEIRAHRVIHDEGEKQLYLEGASLRILDAPVFYLPYLRLPDPSLARAKGFLFPRLRSSTKLGVGVELPYFVPLGDHRDITLSPFVTPRSRTLGLRYRQAYTNGDITLNGAVSSDKLESQLGMRGYLFAEGTFDLAHRRTLEFTLKSVSDEAYLGDYNLSSLDRLDSRITLTEIEERSFTEIGLVHYQTLRETESNATQPTVIGDFEREIRLFPEIGGELRLGLVGHLHYRQSSRTVDTGDSDDASDGRDIARVNGEISWRNRWTLPYGLRAGISTHLWLDQYSTRQDQETSSNVRVATPGVALDLRWPLVRQSANGATLLEPVAQFGWVGGSDPGNANDESTRVEFDESNLLALSRFPADDRREHGRTFAAGIRMAHSIPSGWSAGGTLGRVFREDDEVDFSRSSGLEGTESDWLLALRLAHGTTFALTARGLLDDTNRLSKAEARAAWNRPRLDLGASYLLLVTDQTEARDDAQSEWAIDATYQVSDEWTASTEWRYDLVGERLDKVGLGLRYQHQCVQVDFSASRSYASSTILDPSTDFDLTVALKGFSTGGSAKEYRHSCSL